MQHAKGEWKVKHSESKTAFNVIGTVPGLTYKIARCPYMQIEDSPIYNAKEKNEAEANAKLIAAAPDLLIGLERVLLCAYAAISKHDTVYALKFFEAAKTAEAAIKKATL